MLVRKLIWAFVVVSGVAAVLVCGDWTYIEWQTMDKAYLAYIRDFHAGADLRHLAVGASIVEMHRINGAADGVSFMLGAILAAIGLMGWFQKSAQPESSSRYVEKIEMRGISAGMVNRSAVAEMENPLSLDDRGNTFASNLLRSETTAIPLATSLPDLSDGLTRRVAVVRLEMVREKVLTYPCSVKISNEEDAVAVARAMLDRQDREHFIAMYLNAKHRINAVELIAIGTLNNTLVHPRECLKGALIANAIAMVIAHQHPSGSCEPSPDDIALTRQLLQAAEALGLVILDHLVLGRTTYTSIRGTTDLWAAHPFHN
jgi:DNA repair protein RadC